MWPSNFKNCYLKIVDCKNNPATIYTVSLVFITLTIKIHFDDRGSKDDGEANIRVFLPSSLTASCWDCQGSCWKNSYCIPENTMIYEAILSENTD